jgi:hypothetical protein
MARPDNDYRAVAHRVGIVDYAVYGASPARRPLPWITYEAGWSHLPQARWMAKAVALRIRKREYPSPPMTRN